jgi:hypothetical protein
MSIGRILSPKRGTCWLIAPSRAITAAHCVGSIGTTAEVEFGDSKTMARVLDRDASLDAAILEVGLLINPAPPLSICCRPFGKVTSSWSAFGYPPALDSTMNGLMIGGLIRDFRACRRTVGDTLQLLCDEGGFEHIEDDFDESGDPVQVFAGMSGAAVCATASADRIVGLLVQSPPITLGKVILISPMEQIVERFKASLLDVVVEPWDDTPFLDIRKSDKGACRVTAYPSIENIAVAWDAESKPLRIACDFSRGEAPELQFVLMRLIAHSENIGALEFSNYHEWKDATIQAAKKGLPIDSFDADSAISRKSWSALTAGSPLSSKLIELTQTEIAKEIHGACNRWVFTRLVSELERVLECDSTAELIHFDIAEDLRGPMRELWASWREHLNDSPAFLDHFITLMLTADGDFDVSRTALIAAGPKTLSACLVRLMAFTLAINCCLRGSLQPSKKLPGNLGNAEHTGHACGVQTHNRRHLHLTIIDHVWRTPVVFLPNLHQEATINYAASLPLNESLEKPNTSLSASPPRTWMLTGAAELLQAMGESKGALTSFLGRRGLEFYSQQKSHLPKEGYLSKPYD